MEVWPRPVLPKQRRTKAECSRHKSVSRDMRPGSRTRWFQNLSIASRDAQGRQRPAHARHSGRPPLPKKQTDPGATFKSEIPRKRNEPEPTTKPFERPRANRENQTNPSTPRQKPIGRKTKRTRDANGAPKFRPVPRENETNPTTTAEVIRTPRKRNEPEVSAPAQPASTKQPQKPNEPEPSDQHSSRDIRED